MTKRWKLEDAKAKFSTVVEGALGGEPQLVTRRGRDAVIVLSVKDYERLSDKRSVLDVLQELRGIGELDIERIRDYPRDIDL